MNKKVKQLLLLLFLSLLLSLPYFVFASDTTTSVSENSPLQKMQKVAESSYETADPNSLMTYAGQFISIILGLLGIIFICLLVYAGFNWMTAAGDSDDVKKAKLTIRTSVIGLVITISAYAIWRFIAAYII